MSRRDLSAQSSGLNTAVQHGGSEYHVQTQFSVRDAPVIESLVYSAGQTLVRMTSSYAEVAEKAGFTGDDGRHLLELQHDELIRKIRHGMLGDGEPQRAPEDETPRLIDASGQTVALDEVAEPAVQELLQELGVAIDEAAPIDEPEAPQAAPVSLPWWRRFAITIRW